MAPLNFYGIVHIPKNFFRRLKWSFQRVKYGYCDYDAYDIGEWLCSVIPSALRHFSEVTHTYPDIRLKELLSENNEEEMGEEQLVLKWKEIINEIADNLESYTIDFFDSEE